MRHRTSPVRELITRETCRYQEPYHLHEVQYGASTLSRIQLIEKELPKRAIYSKLTRCLNKMTEMNLQAMNVLGWLVYKSRVMSDTSRLAWSHFFPLHELI